MNRAARRSRRPRAWCAGRHSGCGRAAACIQIQFGEYGGSYVNHCHNTVHEDFALLMRIQLLSGVAGSPQTAITRPQTRARRRFFTTPEVLPEAAASTNRSRMSQLIRNPARRDPTGNP